MGLIKDIVKSSKDQALSSAIKKFAETYMSRFGQINFMEIESSSRVVKTEVLLKGEKEPVTIVMNGFEIISQGKRQFIRPLGVSASRQWMDILAKDLLQGRTFELPSSVAKVLTYLV